MTDTILTVFAFVLFLIAALGVPAGRYSLGWAGAACFTATFLF